MLGSWPVTSDAVSGVWDVATWDLEEALNAARLYRFFPFFVTVVEPDDKNSSSYIITVRSRILHIFHLIEHFFFSYRTAFATILLRP